MGAIFGYIIKFFLLLIIAVISGCSDLLNSDLDKNSKNTVSITAQIVFDEAAKDPDNIDLDKFKAQFYELMANDAQAEILAELKDSTNDYFIHKLLLLPRVQQTDEILEHWLSKLSQPSKIIDKMGADKKPLAILAGGSRSVKVDEIGYRQHMIKILIHYGDAAVVAESNAYEIKLVLAALLAKGDKILMKKAFNGVNDTVKTDVFDWIASKRTKTIAGSHDKLIDVFKNSLLNSDISKQMLIDAAQAGDLNKLKFYYDVVVQNRPVLVPVIANMSAKNGVADRFSHFLAKLVPDAELVNIWGDYLSHVADKAVQVNLPGTGVTPFELLNQQADSEQRNQIIIQMLPHANNHAIDTVIAWSMAHRTKYNVLEAVRGTGKITLNTLRDEVVKPAPNWKKVLFYVQVLAVDSATAKQIADIDTNIGNPGVIKLHLAIVKKAQTQESVSALKYYFNKLTPADWAIVKIYTVGVPAKNAFQIITDKANRADPFETAALQLLYPGGIQVPPADPIIDQDP